MLLYSCGNQGSNVNLEVESCMGYDDVYYEVGSNTPYTGLYTRESPEESVKVDLVNGKMHGERVVFNAEGDTSEYCLFKKGHQTYRLNIEYEGGKVRARNSRKEVDLSVEDKLVFEKAKALIVSEDYLELMDLCGYAYWHQTEQILNQLRIQFGNIDSIEIISTAKDVNSYNKWEAMNAEVIFYFKDFKLRASFSLINDERGNFKGLLINFEPISEDLMPEGRVDRIVKGISNASPKFKFLSMKFMGGEKMWVVKNYLIEVDNEKQVLSIDYFVVSKGKLEYYNYERSPYRTPVEGHPF